MTDGPKNKFLAIIPARKGSKGLVGKNTKLLNGKPLIAYTILAAIEAIGADNVIISTNDPSVIKICDQMNIQYIKRPDALSSDQSKTQGVINHIITEHNPKQDHFILLQPTSPLRTKADILQSIELYNRQQAQSLISITPCDHHPYKMFKTHNGDIVPLHNSKSLSMPRQKLDPCYMQNGAIYIFNKQSFTDKQSFYITPCSFYLMEKTRSIDIDTIEDFVQAESLLSQ